MKLPTSRCLEITGDTGDFIKGGTGAEPVTIRAIRALFEKWAEA
jgi:hypothetical protein